MLEIDAKPQRIGLSSRKMPNSAARRKPNGG
jgi:hypothetical protein